MNCKARLPSCDLLFICSGVMEFSDVSWNMVKYRDEIKE